MIKLCIDTTSKLHEFHLYEPYLYGLMRDKNCFLVNDFSKVLQESSIQAIYVNGNKAYELYHKYAEEKTGIAAIKLPSTSPANAAWSVERLCDKWKQILTYL